MKRVVIIGGGNVAESLAVALAASPKVELVQLYMRSKERATELSSLTGVACSDFEGELAAADLYLLAVSDTAIGEISGSLNFSRGAVVAHTAGSSSIEQISSGLRRAVLYPMQTFTRGRRVAFDKIPIFIESADSEALEVVREVATAISNTVIELGSRERRELHLSAVFVCNFVNAMFIAGEELVGRSSLDFEILKPLIEECCAKALDAPSPRAIQTGPAARGDFATIQKHISMLGEHEELKEIYNNVSKYIWETLKRI